MAQLILKLTSKLDLKPIYAPPRHGDIRQSGADIAKARKEISFKPNISLNNGIKIAVDTVLLSISPLLKRVLLGCGRLKSMAIISVSSVAARWLFITLFLLSGQGLTGVIYGWIIGDSALVAMLVLSTLAGIDLRKGMLRESVKLLPQMLRFSTPLYISTIISFLYAWYDKALILAFLPLEQLGVYNIAYTAFAVLTSIATSLGFSPVLSDLLLIYGRTRTILLLNLTSVALSLTMLPTIGILGLTGLAIVRGTSLLSTFALSAYFTSKTIKIEVDRQTAWKALASATIMALIVLAAQQPLSNNHFLPLHVAIGATTYVALTRKLSILNREDAQLIKEITGGKISKLITKILDIHR